MDKQNKRQLVGRDPAKGRVAFKTGKILSLRNRRANRKTKAGQQELRRQLNDD